MTEPTTPHSVGEPRRRRRFAPVVWGLLLVAVLLATAVQTRRPLIEWALLHLLDANQARNVSLQVEAVDPTRLIRLIQLMQLIRLIQMIRLIQLIRLI